MFVSKMYATFTIAFVLLNQVGSVRITELQVPGHAEEGGSALLGCMYDLEGEDLYSLKWYKDDDEFYRYVPSNAEPINVFPVTGFTVNLSGSSNSMVALEHLTREAAGVYRCEVSGEAPSFAYSIQDKALNIHLLPKSKPRVTGLRDEYQVGDTLAVNCTSLRSRPAAQLKWLVNDVPVPVEHLRGPWQRISRERPDAHDFTLGLGFILRPHHFQQGVMRLKCHAAIAPLYQNEVTYHIAQVNDLTPTENFEDFERFNLYENTYNKEDAGIALSTKSDIELVLKDHGAKTLNMPVLTSFLTIIILYLAL